MTANIIATGLAIDDHRNGTIFPSAGGNSANPQVQAVYWRCAVMLMFSARLTNPTTRLALFSNAAPPLIDGIALGAIFESLGVEIHQAKATTRLARGTVETFGNVLYFMDIFDSLQSEPDNTAVLLLDCDVLVTRDISALFEAIRGGGFAGYRLDTPVAEDINGRSLNDLSRIAAQVMEAGSLGSCHHFGGELFGATMSSWRKHRATFIKMLEHSQNSHGQETGVLTEEHMFSVAFSQHENDVFEANDFIKRIWTSPRHTDTEIGDEGLALWHLPAEKRYGLHDLYGEIAKREFPRDMTGEEFAALAARYCGIPRKSPEKVLFDGIRQIASKLGMRI